MTADRCPTCDREECDRPAAADATAGIPGFGEDCTDEDNAKWSRLGFAVRNCLAHAVTADQWRARALAAEADADSLAKAARIIDAILDKLGARDTGNGGQTVEAGNARIVHDGMRRLDRAIADAARWRKVAPLIEKLYYAHESHNQDRDDESAAVRALLAATQEPTP